MTAAGLIRHHDAAELAALGGVLALRVLAARRFAPAPGRQAIAAAKAGDRPTRA